MKYFLFGLATVVLLCVAGCDVTSDDGTAGTVTLDGQVLNATTNNPVAGAVVRVLPYGLEFETDTEGRFDASVEIDSTMELRVVASMDRYATASETVLGVAGRTSQVVIRMTETAEAPAESGHASNILLLKQSAKSIGVKESGSEEVAQLTFQVADSLGRPVVLTSAVDVNFSFGSQPGGGEFLSPAKVRTDNNGQVTVNLSSGTKAGVVQIVGQATVDGRTIRSLPVAIAIHGGLPDQTHFSLGPEKFNYPTLSRYGTQIPVSVTVGDKYANPVRPGTAVYFTTSHGIIQGSIQTDALGRGSAAWVSAEPMPPQGVVTVTSTTADENRQNVTARTAMVLSGKPRITISSSSAALRSYTFTVTDELGNPLAGGTKISVRVEGTKVKGVGHTSVTLDDTGLSDGGRDNNGDGMPDGARDGDALDFDDVITGPGITHFRFSAVPDMELDEEGTPTVESISILVDGPNGKLELVLLRDGVAFSRTQGATLQNNSGRLVLQMAR